MIQRIYDALNRILCWLVHGHNPQGHSSLTSAWMECSYCGAPLGPVVHDDYEANKGPMMMEFRCRACKEMRPNDQISVKTVDKKADGLPAGTIKMNFNYCNDRAACVETATKWDGY